MPPAKLTSANDHRPLHVDLRTKVIGTNALITALTEQVTRLVEAQTQMAEAIARLVNPDPVRATAAMKPPPGSLAAALDRSNPRQVQSLDPEWGAYSEAQRLQHVDTAVVPRGTGAALMESFRQTAVEVDQRAYAPEPEIELPDGSTGYSSLADQMAQELAEESAWDAEELEPAPPPPPDNHALWQRRLSSWRGSRLWMPEWGPRPGQEGCKAPASMLNGRR